MNNAILGIGLLSVIMIGLYMIGAGTGNPGHVTNTTPVKPAHVKSKEWDRSATNGADFMTLLTDNQTGCQYIVDIGGGITPRMNPNGTQVCKAVSHD